MKIDLRGNVKSIGDAYLTTMKTGHRSLAQTTLTIESESPWRRGPGFGLHIWPGRLLVIGRWVPDYADEDPFDQEELGEIEVDIASSISIRKWGAGYALDRGDLRQDPEGRAEERDGLDAPAREEAAVA